jgi:hypothetical protein
MSVTTVQSSIQQRVAQVTHPTSRIGVVAKHAAIGGVIGAALGAGLSFTALPFIGALSAPLAAAIGGAAGIVVGGIVGLLRTRNAGPPVGAGLLQTPPPPPNTGGALPPAPPL